MHPPFYLPDTRVAHDIAHHHDCKPLTRRGTLPQILRILPMPGWPPVHPSLRDHIDPTVIVVPSGRPAPSRPVLHVVPEPRNALRVIMGRFLIRLGQRMILENRPG